MPTTRINHRRSRQASARVTISARARFGVEPSPVSITALLAALAHHVGDVDLLIAKKQMIRPDAGRIVAPMADVSAVGD